MHLIQYMAFLGCRPSPDSRIYMVASTIDLLERLGQFLMGPFLNPGLIALTFLKSEYLIPIRVEELIFKILSLEICLFSLVGEVTNSDNIFLNHGE